MKLVETGQVTKGIKMNRGQSSVSCTVCVCVSCYHSRCSMTGHQQQQTWLASWLASRTTDSFLASLSQLGSQRRKSCKRRCLSSQTLLQYHHQLNTQTALTTVGERRGQGQMGRSQPSKSFRFDVFLLADVNSSLCGLSA